MTDFLASLSLPILPFSVYFLAAALGAALLGAFRHIFRRGTAGRRCMEDAELLCIAYLVAHLIQIGLAFPANNLIGDLCRVLLSLLPIWLVLLFLRESLERASSRR